ncbi:hypothetical protein U9M48_029408 [Paspalum notatum var. saurae]|uniref:Uncharacterized protein n=1 Tax=Paspalum notatum var. saurae TaxID=547442 RepID=A0AAQ3X2A0_PASNO
MPPPPPIALAVAGFPAGKRRIPTGKGRMPPHPDRRVVEGRQGTGGSGDSWEGGRRHGADGVEAPGGLEYTRPVVLSPVAAADGAQEVGAGEGVDGVTDGLQDGVCGAEGG